MLPQPPIPPLKRLTDWFKTFQKRWNDWPISALAVLLFVQAPVFIWRHYDANFHPFTNDVLNVIPLALVMFCIANAGAYTMFWLQYPDLHSAYIECDENDLLKSDTLTPEEYNKVWRLHDTCQSILSHYFWGLLLSQIAILAMLPRPA